jgi:hypothetical protein
MCKVGFTLCNKKTPLMRGLIMFGLSVCELIVLEVLRESLVAPSVLA